MIEAICCCLICAGLLFSGGISHAATFAPDIEKQASELVFVNMAESPLASTLSKSEQAVLSKLILAASYMDAAYWQQVAPDCEVLFNDLKGESGSQAKAAALLMNANYGKWNRFRNFEPFIGTTPRPMGSYVYPEDLTKDELNAYLEAHPEQKDALLDPYTVVRRKGKELVAIPYHQAYSVYVLPAAKLLEDAADLSENLSLSTYLRAEANALRTDDYFEADMAWIDLDGVLDISIGPIETYDDQLAGVKTFYKANVMLVDHGKAAELSNYKSTAPQLQARLPVDPQFKPDQTGTMMPLEMVDDVRRSGQGRAVMEAVAFSLPNDPRVWKAKGSKKVMMGNYLDMRRKTVLEPLAKLVLDPEASATMDAHAYVTWVLMHEISHTLGPRNALVDGKKLSLREALREHYSPIEEGKADIGGLYNLPYLMERGIVRGSLEAHYVGYLAEALRSIRFGMGSAYGIIRTAAWNYLTDKGALRYEPKTRRYILDTDKMTAAVKELLTMMLEFEGKGDYEGAGKFIDTYARVRPELQELLNEADKTIPVEFVPVYGD